jgi:aminoglycoside phosphotransferase (APT) family kinase protein
MVIETDVESVAGGIRRWLQVVAAAHASGGNDWIDAGVAVHRVSGGSNNALYRVETDGQCCAVKLCVADGRRRAAREYGALLLLHRAGVDLAPQPLCLDESCTLVPFPAVVYRWLCGKSLGPTLTMRELAMLLEGYHSMHTLYRDEHESSAGGALDAWFHWFDFEVYLSELVDFLAEYGSWLATTEPDGPYLRERLARLVAGCAETVRTTSVDPSCESVRRCLCRVDPNLANTVLDESGRLRWVDWEYSGWGDPALDLADLRWHAALSGLSDSQQDWLRENYRWPPDDAGFEERLALWDRLLATRWPFLVLRVLWSAHNGPDRVRLTRPDVDPVVLRERLVRFIERAECLMAGKMAE